MSSVSSQSGHKSSINDHRNKNALTCSQRRDSVIPDAGVEARDAKEPHIISWNIRSKTSEATDENFDTARGAMSHATIVDQADSRRRSPEVPYGLGFNLHGRKWTPHPFASDPPFTLWSDGTPGPYYPRFRVIKANPLSTILGVGLIALEDIYLKIHCSQVYVPQAKTLLDWLKKIQSKRLGDNVSLLGIWIYPKPNRPGIESFRRKVWALLSMINQQIVIPSFGVDSFYLMMVRPDYERLEIRIRIKQGFSAQLVPPPLELQPDD